ncbi:hypothetical protein EMIHUDRAFT_437510 [Emiliania huxleyi CCMP1516]|uniref:EF-hand domain-containing protein n=2 Tax=Emiliania huxleyi TaxID=2903 RepID=A0A0D3IKU0_EMIH1|nr:hypothetical protein EMIHUDRAFT_437510 [Emiliania huxleyi CCMP1516]EOD11875.1 hypothetical protein EMIHUDRAFT_437510 [Emiliania huxleyi CCMP1516]|eukprot:XP_005764304.1 hypothetical protein EMIHUDRAFT_437510 [Emiliania huxleyi CCMP1516]
MNSAASSASHPPPLSTRAAAIRAASLARGTSSAPLVSRGGELRTNDTESRAFIQLRGARTACVVAAAFSILVHTLLAHGVVVGSFWCPLSLCAEMCDEPAALTDSLRWQRRVLAAICLMLDFGVIATHWLMPVHPKFVVVKSRRRVMRAHLLSGSLQCLGGPAFYAALYGGGPAAARAVCVALAAVGFGLHVPGALYLLTSAFGAVRIMIPGFLYATSAYAYSLGKLLTATDARLEHDFLSYWLVLHVYAMNRLVFALLTRFNLLASARYTLSILIGLAIAMPAALGWASFAFCVCAIVVFNLAFLAAADEASRATQDVYSASGFSNAALLPRHFVTPEGLVVAPALAAAERSLSPRERARLVFDKLDTSGDGTISKAELGELLVSWGLPRSDAAACLAEVDGDRSGAIGFDEFFHQLAPVWEFACAVVSSNASVEARLARLLLSGGGAAPSHRGTGGSPAA